MLDLKQTQLEQNLVKNKERSKLEQKALLEAIGDSVSPRSIRKKQNETTAGAEQNNNFTAAATA